MTDPVFYRFVIHILVELDTVPILFIEMPCRFHRVVAPQINPNVSKVTGVICGCRVEAIEDPLLQKIRYLDKLVDELAKGKAMEKILRE